MMTAVMAGVLLLSGAAWTWSQLERLPIPTPTWQLRTTSQSGTVAAGQSLTLQRKVDREVETLGTAVIQTYNTEGGTTGRLVIKDIVLTAADASPRDINRVTIPGADAPVFLAEVRGPTGIPAYPLIYVQAGAAAVIMLLGGILIYWYVAVKPAAVDFLIATDAEMKKVNWSTRKMIQDSTMVVIGATFLIAGIIYVADNLFAQFFRAIKVLGN